MKRIRAASVQFHHAGGKKKSNLDRIRALSREAVERGAALVAFPEMCITGYWHLRRHSREELVALSEPVPSGPSTLSLLELSQDTGASIGAGLIERSDDGMLYNSYVVAMPDGTFAVHRKMHTFISPHMRSGDRVTVFDTPHGWRAAILICYDNNIIENVRMAALAGAEILFAPHQTGGCASRSPQAMGRIDVGLWEDRHTNPEALRAECMGPKGREWLMRWLPARAHDNGLFILFSNGIGRDDDEVRTGNAMILGPYGEILAESREIGDDVVLAELDAAVQLTSSGRRWLQARRPELYGPLAMPTGQESHIRSVRFGTEPD